MCARGRGITPDRMATEFDHNQFDLAYPPGIEHHYWQLARHRIILDELKRLGPTPKVLEVGCGCGLVVKYLRDRGVECRGAELSQAPVVDGAGDFVTVGIPAQELPEAERLGFDTLMLLDVIEHLPDPAGFIGDLLGAFPNVRNLLLTVPARQELWSNYDEFYGHLARYDLGMIDALSRELGWRVGVNRYFFRLLYPPARMIKSRSVQITAPGACSRWLHRLIAGLAVAEYHLLPGGLPGTSIISRLSRP